MKRILSIALSVLLVFAFILVGCGEEAQPTTPTTPTTPTEPTEPTAEKVMWRWASFIPPMDAYAMEAIDWGKQLEEATDGRMTITFYWAESLLKYPGLFDGISSGVAQVGHCSFSVQPERFALQMGLTLPMLFRTAKQTGQAAIDLYNMHEEWREPFGASQLLWMQTPGPGGDLVTKEPVHTMEDLQNMKLSSSSKYEIESYNLLGAVVVPIGVGERYHALETGVVDGSIEDWVAVYMWKMYEPTKYRTVNIDLTMRAYPTIMNTEAYNELPGDIRQIFDEVTDPLEMTIRQNEAWVQNNIDFQQEIKEYDEKVGNPPWYVLPDAERNRWREVVIPLQEEWAEEMEAKGLPGRLILDDMIGLAEEYK